MVRGEAMRDLGSDKHTKTVLQLHLNSTEPAHLKLSDTFGTIFVEVSALRGVL